MATLLETEPPRAEQHPDDLDADRALVARALVDRAAYAILYRHYVDVVYRYCRRRLGSQEAAEDVTAQVFTKALAALPSFRADGASFRSWLFAIAHNTMVDDLRARRADVPLTAATDLPDPAPTPESALLAAETRQTVRTVLASLPPEQARIVELRLAGLTGAEIARTLGRSPNTVKVAQHRAYARLRILLGGRAAGAEVDDAPR